VPHRSELDGLRGLAIVLVLLMHAGIPFHGFGGGMVGVTLFFVLSGFLITSLIVAERRRSGHVDIRNFYLRRVVRLGPALALVAAFVAVAGITGVWSGPWVPGILTAATDTTNWANIDGVSTGLMGHTWSLSIEEQFYLVWPVVLLLAAPARWIALAGAVVGVALYALPIDGAYFSTLTNGGALMAGCAMALWGVRFPRAVFGVGLGLVLVACLKGAEAMAVLGAVAMIGSGSSALSPMAPIGRRAYGLYLWSWPMLLLFGPVAGLVGTILAAEFSYRVVERPILHRFHDRLRPRATPVLGWRAHRDLRPGVGAQQP
jgi:peptidoglycan/LPS O-acetylase OafA/YrhL